MNLKHLLKEVGVDFEISDSRNLVEMGVSSIQLMKFAALLRKEGCNVTFADLISQPTYGDLKKFIDSRQNNNQKVKKEWISHDMHKPFPMTDVQNAYWIGRLGGQNIGGVGCHGYMEIDVKDIDVEKLNKAFYDLQMHHPMLRVVITQDGQQYISDHPYSDNITVYDYRNEDPEEHLKNMRQTTSHRLLDIYNGQVIALQLTLLPDGQARIHYDIDLLVADVTSFQIILRDLVALYNGKTLPEKSCLFNFAEYVINDEKQHEKEIEADRKFWTERIDKLPGKPELPLYQTDMENPVFERHEAFLEPEKWKHFKQTCAAHQITPARALLTLYAMVIARFSTNSEFLINIPLFNRSGEMEGLEDSVADFTTLLLIDCKPGEGDTFLDKINCIDKTFKEHIAHTRYSGVSVQRDYLKLHPGENVVAPIVFSCNLGVPLLNEEFCNTFGDISYMISQTPQVWLDFQLFDIHDGFLMIWDSVKGVFEADVLDSMFRMYQNTLNKISELDSFDVKVELDISDQLEIRASHTASGNYEKCGIHEGFFKKAEEMPLQVALIDTDGTEVTYGELSELAYQVRNKLTKCGDVAGQCIGLCLPRGKMQIAAAMGILAAGAAYVTIGYRQPMKRRMSIIEKSEINIIVADQETSEGFREICSVVNTDEMADDAPHMLTPADPEKTAYIIFTSGSSGEPKGVMISHLSALNTINTINEMYNVSCNDTALQVSQIDFDLSVYDIFGILSVGGRLVLVPQGKEVDGSVLLKLIKQYNVTVYNAVPALVELAVIQAEETETKMDSLRLILSSGDWIPLNLPERINALADKAQFVSLGGATEASIWSNYYNVTLPMPSEFKSIPYGYPLYNQCYRVINDRFEDCPDYVPGELWIGGIGVALGYKGNEAETEAHFVELDGERWYRTGDYGRFWKNGMIEFLGRKDNQIKIRGHRIELEEIEKAYLKLHNLKQAIVLAAGEDKAEFLTAFIVPERAENMILSEIHSNWASFADKKQLSGSAEHFSEAVALYFIGKVLEDLAIPVSEGAVYTLKKTSFSEYGRNIISLWFDWLLNCGYISMSGRLLNGEIKNLKPISAEKELVKKDPNYKFAEIFYDHAVSLINGDETVVEAFFEDGKFDLQEFIQKQYGASEKYAFMFNALEDIISGKNEMHILILAGSYGEALKETVSVCCNAGSVDIVSASVESLEKMRSELKNSQLGFIRMSESEIICTPSEEKYDLIVSLDYLHRFRNLPKVISALWGMLVSKGEILFSEVTKNDPLQLITTAYLENGFSDLEDQRISVRRPLLSGEEWAALFRNAGFSAMSGFVPCSAASDQQVFCAGKGEGNSAVREELELYIAEMVPYYMVPKQTIIMSEIPYTMNGKVDRKALQNIAKQSVIAEKKTLPDSELSMKLADIWKRALHIEELFMEDDFYLLGGDSLVAARIKSMCIKELSFDISLEDLFKNSVFKDFISALEQKIKKKPSFDYGTIIPDELSRYKEFPLTDVQNAYLIGRSGGYAFGDVSSHCYFEMDGEKISADRLEKAWNRLIEIHDMMRAVILSDGSGQKILETVPEYRIAAETVHDEAEFEEKFTEVRSEMAEKVYDSSCWPLFEIRVTYYGNRMRLHTSFDNIVFDGFSIFSLFEQWKKLVDGDDISYSTKLSFRDYVIKERSLKETDQYREDVKYWQHKTEKMFGAPSLPMRTNGDKGKDTRFSRFQLILSNEQVDKIEQLAKKLHLTLPIFFMGAYAEILSYYSGSRQFTLNLTRFQKLPLHPDVEKIIGDFTTLTLLEVDFTQTHSFYERCKRIEAQLYKDMEHSLVSGVEVERMLAHKTGRSGVTMPFVFTSGFGINKKNAYFGEIVCGRSQTPQVYLDQQISIQNGKLHLSWDSVLSVFPDGFVSDMFETYQALLQSISEESNVIGESTNLAHSQRIYQIENEQNCKGTFVKHTLLEKFLEISRCEPDLNAIYSTKENFTYGQLDKASDLLAARILSEGVLKGSAVAVKMEKGAMQIVSVIAVLKAGCYYVPIDIHNPSSRIEIIYKQANVVFEITEDYARDTLHMPENSYSDQKLHEIYPGDIGYVIFTSGSTGVPKGVMITHEAAMNTIDDINRRYNIGKSDGTIFLSNLNFDLSVYDIFGMLSAKGHIVVPDADKVKDPTHWTELLAAGNVTVWNTVPTFMQMMVEHGQSELRSALRLVLLSGDWIPVRLPDQIRKRFGTPKIISLGGATEASIWSNSFEIPEIIPEAWESIPYGKPLDQQGFLILDQEQKRVPVYVPGELYITGKGISKGYINDPEKTAEAFVHIEGVEGVAYRTGDHGKYLPDGTIIFCGRKDHQIKRGGHRIELGEIENQITEIPGIRQAVVTFEAGTDNSLTAHIVADDTDAPIFQVWRRDIALPDKQNSLKNCDELKKFNENADNAVKKTVVYDFKNWGLADHFNTPETIEAVMDSVGFNSRFDGIIRHLIGYLSDYGILKDCGDSWQKTENCEKCVQNIENITVQAPLDELEKRLICASDSRADILRDILDPKELLLNRRQDVLYPDELSAFTPDDDTFGVYMKEYLKKYSDILKDGTIFEISSRTEFNTAKYIETLQKDQRYILLDESLEMMRRKADKIPGLETHLYRMDASVSENQLKHHSSSLIIAENTLHRSTDIKYTLKELRELLIPGGMIVVIENTENQPLLFETVAYFEDGYCALCDERKNKKEPLLSSESWVNLAYDCGFEEVFTLLSPEDEKIYHKNLFVFIAPRCVTAVNESRIRPMLLERLPEYMIPAHFMVYQTFPISDNGKIDRKAMSKRYKDLTDEPVGEEPKTDMEKKIADVWRVLLGVEKISRESSFFALGGDSLMAIRFINSFTEKKITLQMLTAYPILSDLAYALEHEVEEETEELWEEEEEIF
ncbi:MAG: amino acid adenylation domain-containing protein [Ruminococcus sp.]|nr:amino acid adenylation domain-containing protein [Ruminococcus sp.]